MVTLSTAAAVKAISCSGSVQNAGSSQGYRMSSQCPSISQFSQSWAAGGSPHSTGLRYRRVSQEIGTATRNAGSSRAIRPHQYRPGECRPRVAQAK